MQTERWQQIEEIFQKALDSLPEKRAALLGTVCGNDVDLREEIESLLAAHEKSVFTAAGAFQDAVKVLERRAGQLPEAHKIGPYRVIREIGRGGMGSVYLAARADDAYQKLVAIKIIRRGLDTEDIVQRFRSERQILATLDHPNIARLLDGGTTDEGLLYFVMEYIEGEPIDQYCDARKLNLTERLKLFQSVCAAVSYAHQNLVVHRDIKAGNVLVTKDAVPKLLDFGIAKLLAPGATTGDQTLTIQRALTPEYASPEQVRGGPITTASDVYSLGILLYRLLTGHRAYRAHMSSPSEIEHAICDEEPTRPSVIVLREESSEEASDTRELVAEKRGSPPEKLSRRLRGDLDNIVLMALRKDPARRYASAAQFSEDISRHLALLPVIARHDTAAYRAARFITRHRAGVAAVALLIVSLIGGVLATSWQARVARAERAKAQQQFNDVRNLATSFLFEFNSSIQSLPGATPARKLLVQRALEYLSKLSQQAQGDSGLQRDLAEAYLKIGDLQGNPYEPNLGDTQGAEQSYERSLAISSALATADKRDTKAQLYLARSFQSLGEVLPLLGKGGEGAVNLRKAAEIFEPLVRNSPKDRQLRIQLADCYQSLGDLLGHSELQNLGDRAGALESYRKGLAVFETIAADNAKDVAGKGGIAVMRTRIGDMQMANGDLSAALEDYRVALDRAESLVADDPKNDRFQRILALCNRKIADVEGQRGNFKAALQNAIKASEINQALAAADPDNAQASMNFALSLTTTADLMSKTGDQQVALAKYRQVVAILEKRSKAAPDDVFINGRLGESLISLGGALTKQSDKEEARKATSRGLVLMQELASRSGVTPDELSRYAVALLTCEPADLRQPALALQKARQAVDKSGGKDPKDLDILARAYFENRDSAAAIEAENKALGLLPPSAQAGSLMRQRIEGQLAKYESGRTGR